MCACNDPVGNYFYEYILLYVDDVLCISKKPQEVIACIRKLFPMKPSSIAKPEMYLGTKVSEIVLPNGVIAWAWSDSKYA